MDTGRIERSERLAFLVFLGAVAVAVAWLVVRPLLAPLVLAILTAVVIQPGHRRVERLLGPGTVRAALASTVGVTLLVAVPAELVGQIFLAQLREVANELIGGEVRSRLSALLREGFTGVSDFLSALVGRTVRVEDLAREAISRLGSLVYERIPDAVSLVGRFALASLIFYLVLFFLLLRGGRLAALVVELLPLGEVRIRRILDRLERTIQGVFLGALATAMLQGVVAALGFWLTGFENFLVWAALVAAAGLVPVVGTGLVWGPAALYLGLTDQTAAAVAMVAVGVVVSTVDNFVRPLVIHGRSAVHPLLVFLGVFGGLRAMGPMGLIYGPLLMACFAEGVRIYREDFHSRPSLGEDAEVPPSPS